MSDKMTLAEFKRTLKPGLKLTRSFFNEGDLQNTPEKRTVTIVTSTGFVTEGTASPISSMHFGSAKEWEFDQYIGGFSALWTDPNNPDYQTQYIVMD